MTKQRSRTRRSIATQTAELALAAPQVMANRLGRLALAGARPSPHDRREFARMIVEKQTAAGQAVAAIAAQSWLGAPRIAASMMRAAWAPWLGASHRHVAAQMQDTGERIVAGALAPMHRAATANARRLSRAPKRK